MRVGQMNANVIRVTALGKRLTRMANLSDGEFDFGNPPALGGAEERCGRSAGPNPEPPPWLMTCRANCPAASSN